MSNDALRQHYTNMCRIRAFEEAAIRALKAGEVHGAIHPSVGQEAVASGVCSNLRQDDILLSTHRGHGHTLIKGADPLAMMRELLGRDGGCCGGKGGSMHIADFDVGMLGANGVVGANIVIAAGAAHAIKLKGDDRIAVCIFGDGAINRGPFLEGLNWARVANLPCLFICEDNGWASTTSADAVTGGPGAGARAESLGLPSIEVDGNDIEALENVAKQSIEAVRNGGGPRFIHAKTYRLLGHTAADPGAYRDDTEVQERWKSDPIARVKALLIERGDSEDQLGTIAENADAEMDQILTAAIETSWPELDRAWDDVQDIGFEQRQA